MPVRFEIEGPVAKITLDRPEVHNAIDLDVHRELVECWTRFRDAEGLRVAVLTGAGSKAFCAGVDVGSMGEFYARRNRATGAESRSTEPGIGGITRNFDPGKPVIAAVNGYCLGGGLELALACDIRLASTNATFGLPELQLAIIPGQGGTQRLPRVIPRGVALEMILTGRPIDAGRALQLGLVSAVHPPEVLMDEALRLAGAVATRSPRAVRHAREAVLQGLDMPLSEGLELEQRLAEPLRDSAENRAARESFSKRRKRPEP